MSDLHGRDDLSNDQLAEAVLEERFSRLRPLNLDLLREFMHATEIVFTEQRSGELEFLRADFEVDTCRWALHLNVRDEGESFVFELSAFLLGTYGLSASQMLQVLNEANSTECFSRYLDQEQLVRVEYLGHYTRGLPCMSLHVIEALFSGMCQYVLDLHEEFTALSLPIPASRSFQA